MDKAEQIAKEIWKLSPKYHTSITEARIIEGFYAAGSSFNRADAEILVSIWTAKLIITRKRFHRYPLESLGRELAYIVLVQSVREFLENG